MRRLVPTFAWLLALSPSFPAAAAPAPAQLKVAVLGAAVPDSEIAPRVKEQMARLGAGIARRGGLLFTGACPGVPQLAARAAFAAGGTTIGVSPASSLVDHLQRFKMPTESLTKIQFAGTGPGAGLIEREAPLVKQADILVYVSGRSGTLGELAAGMHAPKVIALLEGSGGVTDGARTRILPYVGTGRAVVVADTDADRLLAKAEAALAALKARPAATSGPAPVLAAAPRPPMTRAPLLDRRALAGRDVFAFFGNERDLTKEDRARVDALVAQIQGGAHDRRPPLLVMSTRPGLTEAVAERAQSLGVETLGVSAAGSVAQHLKLGYATRGLDHVQLTGKGAGVGEFAAVRPVVESANVVFVAGGDHHTLGATVYASYRNTVLAVLTTAGMSGKIESDIWKTFEKPPVAKMIYDSDPARLYRRAVAAADEIRKAERAEYVNAE
jgi:hypothetical protein